jgi:hypothetical protein
MSLEQQNYFDLTPCGQQCAVEHKLKQCRLMIEIISRLEPRAKFFLSMAGVLPKPGFQRVPDCLSSPHAPDERIEKSHLVYSTI